MAPRLVQRPTPRTPLRRCHATARSTTPQTLYAPHPALPPASRNRPRKKLFGAKFTSAQVICSGYSRRQEEVVLRAACRGSYAWGGGDSYAQRRRRTGRPRFQFFFWSQIRSKKSSSKEHAEVRLRAASARRHSRECSHVSPKAATFGASSLLPAEPEHVHDALSSIDGIRPLLLHPSTALLPLTLVALSADRSSPKPQLHRSLSGSGGGGGGNTSAGFLAPISGALARQDSALPLVSRPSAPIAKPALSSNTPSRSR
jgi:hypothetical protein